MNIDNLKKLLELDDESKKNILHDTQFIKQNKLMGGEIFLIIESLGEKAKADIMSEEKLIREKLKLHDSLVSRLLKEFNNDELKLNLTKQYGLYGVYELNVICSCDTVTKLNIILEDEERHPSDKKTIISSLDSKSIVYLLRDKKEFIKRIDSAPYMIIAKLSTEKQIDIVRQIEDMNLDLHEKRCIFATLSTEAKDKIDKSNLPEEYKTAIDIKMQNDYHIGINFDFNRSVEDYRGMDNLIVINLKDIPDEQRKRLFELYDICPNVKVHNNIKGTGDYVSSIKEYKHGEQWIDSVIEGLNPEWTDLQKLAAIDNAIGRKISYAPDFDTEIENSDNVRALWKIISTRLWSM